MKGWAEVYRKPVRRLALEAVAVQAHSNATLIVPVLGRARAALFWASGVPRRRRAKTG